jgi:putative phage-type endonuclease
MLSEQQHAMRMTGIGSSDIAQVVGCSPFGDASKLWLVKRGRLVEPDNAATRAGTWLEDGVATWAAHERGWKLQRINRTLRHSQRAWVLATPDRFLLGDKKRKGQVEIKTSMSTETHGWGEEGTDQIPRHIRCQVQWQMTVTGQPTTHVVLFTFNDRRLHYYEVPHSPELEAALLDAGHDFWHQHVLADQPPEVDMASPHAAGYLGAVYKQLGDEVVPAPLTSDVIAEQLHRAQLDLVDAGQRKEVAENTLKAMVGERRGIEAPWGKFLWSKCKGKVADGKLADALMDRLAMPAVERAELRDSFRGAEYRRVNFTYRDPEQDKE